LFRCVQLLFVIHNCTLFYLFNPFVVAGWRTNARKAGFLVAFA
jgi:hypothetical protein